MIGAKIAPRLNVRCHDGACGSRSRRARALGARLGRRPRRDRPRCPRRRSTRSRGGAPSRGGVAASSWPSGRLCRATPGDPPACDHRVARRRRRGGRRDAASRRPRRGRRRRRSPAQAGPSGPRARGRAPRSRCTPTSASSGASDSCVAASEQTSGRLSQNALPGLKSVASATAAPASTSARAGGIGRPEEERARRQQHTGHVARARARRRPPRPVASRWSTDRAPSSIASGIAPDSVNWSPCSRSARPASRHAVR